jgi:two-component system CheB/CheR fusion protein
MVVIEVSDTGIGIDEKTLPVIFNAFEQGEQAVTRRFGGLGLGLAISKSLVDMHAGHLSAASAGLGMGATFTIALPMADVERGEMNGWSAAPTHGVTVLVLEDHKDRTGVMRPLLERPGYTIYTAYSMEAAMKVAGEQRFDLLIGNAAAPRAELVAALNAHAPVRVILLGNAADDAGEAGANLPRPFSAKALYKAIDTLLAKEKE